MSITTKILIVEHDPIDLELIQKELKRGGINYTSEVVQDASAYEYALANFVPDIILSDYNLPSFDGITAFQIKEQMAPDTPFIFVSGTIGEENSIALIGQGVTDYVLKDKLLTLNIKVKRALKETKEKQRIKEVAEQIRISEKELYLVKDKQAVILNTLPANIAMLDKNGVIVNVNNAWIEFAERNNLPGRNHCLGDNYIDVSEKVLGKDRITALETAVGIRRILDGTLKRFSLEYGCDSPTEKRWFIEEVRPMKEGEYSGAVVMHINITAQKIAERKMVASEAQYRRLFEAAQDGILILDGETGIIEDVNPFLEEKLGFSHEEIIGKQLWELGFFKDVQENKAVFEKLKKEEYIRYEDIPLKTKEGKPFWVEFVSNVYDVLGRQVIQCNIRDITKRKHSEDSLKESEKSLKESQEIAHLGSWQSNFATGVTLWSEEHCRIFGILPKENLQTMESWKSFIHPEDVQHVLASNAEAEKTLTDTTVNYRIVLQNGTIKSIYSKRKFEFDKSGKLTGIFGTSLDVSELKKAEQERDSLLLDLENRVALRTHELAEKNKNITDNINYAERIQHGLLSRPTQLKGIFPQSFILDMPRDIVSGDFFWCYQRRNKKFIAVADCTGHGVSAAMMSIVGNNLLNHIVVDEHIENPSEILELLDTRLSEAVKGDTGEVKDGMDLALCVIDNNYNELYFAGALRPLFISNAYGKINELPPNRHSVGGGIDEGEKKFTTHRMPLYPGQRIYLSSDGYYSQFGGAKGKKYMKAQFTHTLEEIQHYPINEQKASLATILNEWTGDLEQVDDIMVIGIEL